MLIKREEVLVGGRGVAVDLWLRRIPKIPLLLLGRRMEAP